MTKLVQSVRLFDHGVQDPNRLAHETYESGNSAASGKAVCIPDQTTELSRGMLTVYDPSHNSYETFKRAKFHFPHPRRILLKLISKCSAGSLATNLDNFTHRPSAEVEEFCKRSGNHKHDITDKQESYGMDLLGLEQLSKIGLY